MPTTTWRASTTGANGLDVHVVQREMVAALDQRFSGQQGRQII